jgi:hypothetical protein
MLEGKQHQLGIALQIERLHDVVLVEFDSLLAQVQLIGDLLDGKALREQLDNIALPVNRMFGYMPALHRLWTSAPDEELTALFNAYL